MAKDDLSKLLTSIEKEFKGVAKVSAIEDVKVPFHKRVPTGIMSLDLALGGGFPAGGIVQIFGPEGVGKDYLTNLLMATNQKRLGEKSNLFWTSFGYKPDLPFMRMAGVKVRITDQELRLLGMSPEDVAEEERGETPGHLHFIDLGADKEAYQKPAEYILTTALRMIESGAYQIGIINELGSGETTYNVKKGLHEEARMASWASLLSDFFRKYYTAMRRPLENGEPNETLLVMINPVRANLNAYTAKFIKYEQGGGHALRHAKVIDLHLDKSSKIRAGKDVVGFVVKWKVGKGKHGVAEGAAGEYKFYANHGVDQVDDLCNVAKAMGVLVRAGPTYYWWDDEERNNRLTGGLEGVVELVRGDEELQERIREEILRRANAGAVDD